jgi:hypothetical protein
MRKLLLATAGVIALAAPAMATEGGGHGNGHGHQMRTIENYYAAALGLNVGSVEDNTARTSRGHAASTTMRGSFGGARGVMNVNQNAGANSGQQNAVAVAYIEGCDCRVTPKSGDADANAVAGNIGQVVSNDSANGSRERRGHDDKHGGGGTSASTTLDGSFGNARGIAQVNQNAGANSLQQNSTAAVYVDGIAGRTQDRDAWAIAVNAGQVTGSGNSSSDRNHTASNTMTNAFGGFLGVANVNQNSGANSLQQNSVALSAITYCDCAAQDLSTTIAAAANLGRVMDNRASSSGGVASSTMTGSFNGATGVINVSQNAGANSLAQNSVAVGAVYRR